MDAFKNLINENVVRKLARGIAHHHPEFNSKKFLLLLKNLNALELKNRVLLITEHIKLNLDLNYPESLNILMQTMEESDLKGFELWPFSEFISQFGLELFDESMKAMYQLTQRFTS